MELLILWRIVRRWWWIGIIPVIITAALAVPALLNRTPAASGGFGKTIQYSAAQSLEAIPRTEGDYQDIWLSSELTVNAFTEWIRGTSFKEEVIAAAARQGVTIDPNTFPMFADNARSVGRIDIGYPTAEGLDAISAAIKEVLTTRSQVYFPQLGGEPAAVTIISETPSTPAPPPIANRFEPLLRIALGVLAGIVLMALVHYFDPYLRSRSEVTSSGLRVLGTIPRK